MVIEDLGRGFGWVRVPTALLKQNMCLADAEVDSCPIREPEFPPKSRNPLNVVVGEDELSVTAIGFPDSE